MEVRLARGLGLGYIDEEGVLRILYLAIVLAFCHTVLPAISARVVRVFGGRGFSLSPHYLSVW